MVSPNQLIVRFLHTRWWLEVEDLVVESVESKLFQFDDLDLDADFQELRRGVSEDGLLQFVDMVLDGRAWLEKDAFDLELFENDDDGKVFLVLFAVNLGVFFLGPRAWKSILAHMQSEGAIFKDWAVFGRILSRNQSSARVKAWLRENLEAGADLDACLEACQSPVHAVSGGLIHLGCERKKSERQVLEQARRLNWQSVQWQSAEASLHIISIRRVGQFSTFLIGGEGGEGLAKALSHKRSLEHALFVDFTPGVGPLFREYKKSRLVSDEKPWKASYAAALGEDAEFDNEALIGELLARRVRVYDSAAVHCVGTLDFKEASQSRTDMGRMRRWSFRPLKKE